MLGAHPDIHTSAEPWLMLQPAYALRDRRVRADYEEPLARAAVREFLTTSAGGEETYLDGVRAFASHIYGEALRRAGKRFSLDKTPRYYLIVPELRRIFPAARFVFLIRNPLAVLSSILNHWVKPDWPLRHFQKDLVDAPRALATAIEAAPGSIVRYEALVTEPEGELRRLCAELGMSFHESMLHYADGSGLEGSFGDVRGTERFDGPAPSRIDSWRELGQDPAKRDLALSYLGLLGDALLDRFGYPGPKLRASLRAPSAGAITAAAGPVDGTQGSPEWRLRDRPKITVVTPCLNQVDYLERTIRSVLSQDYPNLEYIIIDGGSTDGSVEIIKRYEPWLAHWVSAPDDGQFDAINKGFALSTGELMAWLNADDLHFPWTLDTVAGIFTDCAEVEWLSSSTLMVFGPDDSLAETIHAEGYTRSSFYRGQHLSGRPGFTQYIQQEATFWRRSLWEEAGSSVEDSLEYAGDFELWARFYAHADLATVTCPLGGFRMRPGQKTEVMDHYVEEAERVLHRYRNAALRNPALLKLGRLIYRLTGRGGRIFGGSRRMWVTWLPRPRERWVSGWNFEI